uniref:Uncharacterized protein n=1 Tax=Molossus molossus TaxID=27622 RepID=A0A7J8DBU5_MOLMO|nr:hypothetical protein HJG59_009384 [Molossus molossus]
MITGGGRRGWRRKVKARNSCEEFQRDLRLLRCGGWPSAVTTPAVAAIDKCAVCHFQSSPSSREARALGSHPVARKPSPSEMKKQTSQGPKWQSRDLTPCFLILGPLSWLPRARWTWETVNLWSLHIWMNFSRRLS